MGIFELIAAVVGSSTLTALVSSFFSRKKVAAEASVAVVEVTLKWAASLANRIEQLERQLTERDSVIAELRERIAVLEAQANGGRRPTPSG